MSSFGFDKAKKSGTTKPELAKELAKRLSPVVIDEDAEARAIKAGEKAGFVAREDSGGQGQETMGRRRKHVEPQGRLLVTGPERVLSRFRSFSDDNAHKAYWNALEELMDEYER